MLMSSAMITETEDFSRTLFLHIPFYTLSFFLPIRKLVISITQHTHFSWRGDENANQLVVRRANVIYNQLFVLARVVEDNGVAIFTSSRNMHIEQSVYSIRILHSFSLNLETSDKWNDITRHT